LAPGAEAVSSGSGDVECGSGCFDRKEAFEEGARPVYKEDAMAIGPVQLITLGFEHPDFTGEVLKEFDRLRDDDTVRIIDALVVFKDADGDVAVIETSQLDQESAMEFGATVGALVGLGAAGEEGAEAGAVLGAEAAEDGLDVFDDDDVWDVLEELPLDAAAALVLLEHRWAIPLRDKLAAAGGYPIGAGMITPIDLMEIGLITALEAESLE
jgi:uncharacterized membrane protein